MFIDVQDETHNMIVSVSEQEYNAYYKLPGRVEIQVLSVVYPLRKTFSVVKQPSAKHIDWRCKAEDFLVWESNRRKVELYQK